MNLAEMAGFHLKSAHLGGGKIKPRDVWKMNLCDDKKHDANNWPKLVQVTVSHDPHWQPKSRKVHQDSAVPTNSRNGRPCCLQFVDVHDFDRIGKKTKF